MRRDGSSRFGKGNKFGVFPSVGAGWHLHEEAFMKPLKDQISEFKAVSYTHLRPAGWGGGCPKGGYDRG